MLVCCFQVVKVPAVYTVRGAEVTPKQTDGAWSANPWSRVRKHAVGTKGNGFDQQRAGLKVPAFTPVPMPSIAATNRGVGPWAAAYMSKQSASVFYQPGFVKYAFLLFQGTRFLIGRKCPGPGEAGVVGW
jgi:hypothetical protein